MVDLVEGKTKRPGRKKVGAGTLDKRLNMCILEWIGREWRIKYCLGYIRIILEMKCQMEQ